MQAHLGGSDEELEEDEALIKKFAAFLKDNVIPTLVDDVVSLCVNPVDSYSIQFLFHGRGVNMWYLGTVVQLVQQKSNYSEIWMPILGISLGIASWHTTSTQYTRGSWYSHNELW